MNSLIKLFPIQTREASGSPNAKKLNNFKTVLAMTTMKFKAVSVSQTFS